jgi:hypothetical protein
MLGVVYNKRDSRELRACQNKGLGALLQGSPNNEKTEKIVLNSFITGFSGKI